MIKKNNTAAPKRERVVMDEANGFGHIEQVTPEQFRRLASDSPAYLAQCRTTRTTKKGDTA